MQKNALAEKTIAVVVDAESGSDLSVVFGRRLDDRLDAEFPTAVVMVHQSVERYSVRIQYVGANLPSPRAVRLYARILLAASDFAVELEEKLAYDDPSDERLLGDLAVAIANVETDLPIDDSAIVVEATVGFPGGEWDLFRSGVWESQIDRSDFVSLRTDVETIIGTWVLETPGSYVLEYSDADVDNALVASRLDTHSAAMGVIDSKGRIADDV